MYRNGVEWALKVFEIRKFQCSIVCESNNLNLKFSEKSCDKSYFLEKKFFLYIPQRQAIASGVPSPVYMVINSISADFSSASVT